MVDETVTQETIETVVEQSSETVPLAVTDRREALAQAFESAVKEQPEKETATVETQDQKISERQRDEQGRFAASEKTETQGAASEEQKTEKPKRRYLESWKKDVLPLHEELEKDPKWQPILDEIERRDADYHKGTENYKSAAQFALEMRRTIEPYAETITKLGISPSQAVGHLFEADRLLRTADPAQRAQYFRQLAKSYGIDADSLADIPDPDPHVVAMNRELTQARQARTEAEHRAREFETARAQEEISEFAKTHPMVEAVYKEMSQLLESGFVSSLQDAYDKAIRLNDTAFARLQAQQQEAAEKERRQKAVEAARLAKSAAVSVTGAAPAGGSAASPQDRRALIASQFR